MEDIPWAVTSGDINADIIEDLLSTTCLVVEDTYTQWTDKTIVTGMYTCDVLRWIKLVLYNYSKIQIWPHLVSCMNMMYRYTLISKARKILLQEESAAQNQVGGWFGSHEIGSQMESNKIIETVVFTQIATHAMDPWSTSLKEVQGPKLLKKKPLETHSYCAIDHASSNGKLAGSELVLLSKNTSTEAWIIILVCVCHFVP